MRLSTTFLGSIALAAALAGCGKPKPAEPQNRQETASAAATSPEEPGAAGIVDRSHAGTPAPATPFDSPDSRKASFADFRGKPLLVNLWATWCAPCVAEMPTLDALAGREKDRLQVLPVSQDLDGKDKVHAFFGKMKFANLKPFVDGDAELSNQLKVQTLPTTILYDADGKEVWRITGREDWGSARAAGLLKEAVKG
ncbi:MAG: TlpA family protein disulfide reductase [Sphingomonadales bacterium]